MEVGPLNPRDVVVSVWQAEKLVLPQPVAQGIGYLKFAAEYLPICQFGEVQSCNSLGQNLHYYWLVCGNEKSSESLKGEGLQANWIKLRPEAERCQIDDVDIFLKISRTFQDVKMQPVVIADLWLVLGIGQIGEIG